MLATKRGCTCIEIEVEDPIPRLHFPPFSFPIGMGEGHLPYLLFIFLLFSPFALELITQFILYILLSSSFYADATGCLDLFPLHFCCCIIVVLLAFFFIIVGVFTFSFSFVVKFL